MSAKTSSSNQKTDMTNTSQNIIDPRYAQAYDQQSNNLLNRFNSLANSPLTQYQAPLYSSTLDPIVQNQVSRGVQDINQQRTASQNTLAQTLSRTGSGNNGNLLAVLNNQGALQAAGAKNALMAPALEAQRAQDVQRQNLLASLNAQSLAARAQQFNELTPGMGLLELLQNQSKLTAKNVSTQKGTQRTKSSSFGI